MHGMPTNNSIPIFGVCCMCKCSCTESFMEAHWSKHRLIARAVFFSAQGRMLGQGMEAQGPAEGALSTMCGETLKENSENLKQAKEAGAEASGKAAEMLDEQLTKILANTTVKTDRGVMPKLPAKVAKHVDDLKTMINNGGDFDPKGAMASMFHRAVKNDPDLKARKEAECKGKGNIVLQQFKLKWAKESLTHIMKKHIKTEEIVDLEKLDAEFCTIDRMWSREGGTPAALQTCQVFTESALDS